MDHFPTVMSATVEEKEEKEKEEKEEEEEDEVYYAESSQMQLQPSFVYTFCS